MNHILGISCYYHDSAACIFSCGELIASAQEERFTRVKHTPDFPLNSIRYCLEESGLSEKQGTKITFKASNKTFSKVIYDFSILSKRLQELSFLNAGIHIELMDERDEKKKVFD